MKFGAGILSARASMRLKGSSDPRTLQKHVLKQLIPKLAEGIVWGGMGVEAGMTYDEFRERVPLQTYEGLAKHIEKMKGGEENVLWPGACQLYALSSGTTAGQTKYIPVTETMLGHFKKAALNSVLWYTARTGSTNVFLGRHLFLGGSNSLAPIPESEPFEA